MSPPSIGGVYRDVWGDLWGNLRVHVAASLPLACVALTGFVASYAALPLLWPRVFRWMFWAEDELVWLAAWAVATLVVIPFFSVVLPFVPLTNGMMHLQARWLSDGVAPGATGPLRWAGHRLLPMAVVLVPLWTAQSIAIWAGLLPAIALEALFGFAAPALIVHGLAPGAAVQLSVTHFLRAPLWRLGFSTVLVGAVFLGGGLFLPLLVLPAFVANAGVRAYQGWFGSGEVPRGI